MLVKADKGSALPRLRELLLRSEMITIYVLVALVAVTSILNPSFLTVDNLVSILKQYSFYAICGVMLTFLMVSKAFDMSLGNTVALSGCVAAIMMRDFGVPFWGGVMVALALGTVLGLINGFLHGVLKIQAFMATLGTCFAYKGIFWVLSNQASIDCSAAVAASGIPNMAAGLPISIWVLMVLAVAGHIVLKYTKFGRSTYIIGNNVEVAREIGISETRVKVILFGCLGFVSALCAVCFILTYGAIPPSTGSKYEFYVNAGTVIGGCSVYGGRGTIAGSLVGTAVMTVVQFALRSLNVPPGYQNTALGAILLLAVLLDTIKEKMKT
ncbi:ABC transporter permease [Butyricicoccus sp. 1XD8-22]|nr:ABC transporter permease [Butyricicoccus sp. 1XD8-22]